VPVRVYPLGLSAWLPKPAARREAAVVDDPGAATDSICHSIAWRRACLPERGRTASADSRPLPTRAGGDTRLAAPRYLHSARQPRRRAARSARGAAPDEPNTASGQPGGHLAGTAVATAGRYVGHAHNAAAAAPGNTRRMKCAPGSVSGRRSTLISRIGGPVASGSRAASPADGGRRSLPQSRHARSPAARRRFTATSPRGPSRSGILCPTGHDFAIRPRRQRRATVGRPAASGLRLGLLPGPATSPGSPARAPAREASDPRLRRTAAAGFLPAGSSPRVAAVSGGPPGARRPVRPPQAAPSRPGPARRSVISAGRPAWPPRPPVPPAGAWLPPARWWPGAVRRFTGPIQSLLPPGPQPARGVWPTTLPPAAPGSPPTAGVTPYGRG